MGYSKYRFEQICEEKYNRYLEGAIRQIENGQYPHYPWIDVEGYDLNTR